MEATFYIAAGVAILSTIMVITSYNMIHALIYLIVSFLAIGGKGKGEAENEEVPVDVKALVP